MSHYIDLNSDLGESFGNYTLGIDSEVLNHVTSANVACGWHAGDPLIMETTVKMCKEKGVAVGAHPGYPDLMGFGRRKMAVSPDEARAYMIYQLGALQGFCNQYDVELQHMKLHGAFYNMAGTSAHDGARRQGRNEYGQNNRYCSRFRMRSWR